MLLNLQFSIFILRLFESSIAASRRYSTEGSARNPTGNVIYCDPAEWRGGFPSRLRQLGLSGRRCAKAGKGTQKG